MSNPHYDVVIAGAGPAGCAAAIRLQQLQLSVCLVDEVKEDELKVGESLPGAAIRLLNRLGIKDLSQLLPKSAFLPCVANVSAWGTEQWTYNDAIRNPEQGGWHLMRHQFDAALRKLAIKNGVDFYKGKIGKINKDDHSIYLVKFKQQNPNLPETLSAKYLVDATGRAAAVLKQFKVLRHQFETQMAAIAWFQPDFADKDQTTRIKSVENGWWYSSKLPDHTRVFSFHGLPTDIAKMVKSPQEFINSANKCKLKPKELQIKALKIGVRARKAGVALAAQVAKAPCIAVGDAALSFDPLSSQGIFFALYSGIRAAEGIDKILKTTASPSLILRTYEQQIQSIFAANQRSRKLHYTMEQRFKTNPYWAQYYS